MRDERARETALLADAGWVAAVRVGEEQPSWIVSASDDAELAEAAELLDAGALADHYAIATAGGVDVPLPDREGLAAEAAGDC